MATPRYPLLYLAYGANTNRSHMARRCPTAKYVGNAELLEHRLIFRGVADVIPVKGQKTVCALWTLQPSDERALDVFEGFPHHYGKRYALIEWGGVERDAMFYVMAGNRRDRHEPPQSYEETLRRGYAECGMSARQITSAVRDACKSERRQLRYHGQWAERDRERGLQFGDAPKRKPAQQQRAAQQGQPVDLATAFPDWPPDAASAYFTYYNKG